MSKACVTHWEGKNAYRILVEKCERKRTVRKSKSKLEVNVQKVA
jgi:hypothetical protein